MLTNYLSTWSVRSLVKIRKRVGLRTEPGETLALTLWILEDCLLTATFMDLISKKGVKFSNYIIIGELVPHPVKYIQNNGSNLKAIIYTAFCLKDHIC